MRTRRHTVLEVVAWLLLLASYGIAIYGMRHCQLGRTFRAGKYAQYTV